MIERFLTESGLSATAFGVLAMKDPRFVHEMRAGRVKGDRGNGTTGKAGSCGMCGDYPGRKIVAALWVERRRAVIHRAGLSRA